MTPIILIFLKSKPGKNIEERSTQRIANAQKATRKLGSIERVTLVFVLKNISNIFMD